MSLFTKNIGKDFIFGALAGYVPITLMSFQYNKGALVKNGHSYIKMARTVAWMFAFANILIMALMRVLGIKNLFVIGFISAMIFSSYGRFIANVPRDIFEMKNENWFHVYAAIIWTLFYGVGGGLYYNYIC